MVPLLHASAYHCPLQLRMADQMQTILSSMNASYQALSEVEAEVLVDTEGKLLGLVLLGLLRRHTYVALSCCVQTQELGSQQTEDLESLREVHKG